MAQDVIEDAYELLPMEQRDFNDFYKLKRHELHNFDNLFYEDLPAVNWKRHYENLLRTFHKYKDDQKWNLDAQKIITFCLHITSHRIIFTRCEEKTLDRFKTEWYQCFKEKLRGKTLKWNNFYVYSYVRDNYASSRQMTSNSVALTRLSDYFIKRGMAVLTNHFGYELIQEVWYELFDCENLNIEQAKLRLERISHTEAVHKVNPLTMEDRINRFVKYCEKNQIVIEFADTGLDTIKSVWKKLFGTDLTASQVKERRRGIKKQASHLFQIDCNSRIKQYCNERNIIIESNIEGFNKFKNIWEQLFKTTLTNKQARDRKKRFVAYAPELYERTESLKQLRLSYFIEYCHKKGVVLSYGGDGKSHMKDLWGELFGELLSDGQIQDRFKHLYTGDSGIALKPIKRITTKTLKAEEYQKILEYCTEHNIVILADARGIKQIQNLWIELFDNTLTSQQAKYRRKTLKSFAPSLIEVKKRRVDKQRVIMKNQIEVEDIYSLDEKTREELLITFCEYCESRSLSFIYNESDEASLKNAWRECFGIK